MNLRLLTLALKADTDMVLARKRTRRLAELIGFDPQEQTRITTAVSEIARNALEHADGGSIEFRLSGTTAQQNFEITIADRGGGIKRLGGVLDGSVRSETGMGVGLIGARRLMDEFAIDSVPGIGTTVRLAKHLPRRTPSLDGAAVKRITQELAADVPPNPIEEIQRQNQEMLLQLGELQTRQEDLSRLNQELQETNRGVVALYAELDDRADHLRRADELKSRFLSNMSHEFRTPLNSILALSRLLLGRVDGDLSAEQEKQVQFIRRAAESLTELVNDLLDLAKVAAGKIVVSSSQFDASGLFATLRGMLRPLLVGDGVALVFEEPSDIPPLVTDEPKLSQILRNFISNAIKFTERGEVRIWAVHDPDADTVTFSVKDTGIGIADSDHEVIFQEFGQVANPIQRRVKGTGLGLPLSKQLAELLGGGVGLQSAPGQGSVFFVTIPRIRRRTIEPVDQLLNWQVEPGRVPILILEDDSADAFTFERIFAPSSYQPFIVRTIDQARRALEQLRPAAVLLDALLEGDESWRFLIELRQREATANIPIAMISSTGDERKAINLGADEYLGKPVDADQLVRLLDRMTGRSSVTRVLLVDDEEVSRYLVRQLLPRGLYDIREAATGMEGLAQIRDNRPDIVLFDLNMPGMDGYQFLDRLDTEGSVPAIVLTSMILDREQRVRLGRAANIVSKSDLSSPMLTAAIGGALTAAGAAA
ncbi:MAG TPA: ATP-binding protein [Stellaceae bacterium]|jgi:signal transduction histidine kinase/CheY-like chemotaxis protein|nr:ATP-binding protein [Stellaceae bacterium]